MKNIKPTGMPRRVDRLGRAVIPKEIRRSLDINANDFLEIFIGEDGEIILKKIYPDGDVFAENARLTLENEKLQDEIKKLEREYTNLA